MKKTWNIVDLCRSLSRGKFYAALRSFSRSHAVDPLAGSTLFAAVPPWQDPSPHSVQFVVVDQSVRLEVLDWGGTGRPVVLLAGGGNTARIFDEFAPKLSADYHVYGITRRGFCASGFAPADDAVDRFGDDVVEVIDALKLNRPVLAGYSLAGAEMSSVANRKPKGQTGRLLGC